MKAVKISPYESSSNRYYWYYGIYNNEILYSNIRLWGSIMLIAQPTWTCGGAPSFTCSFEVAQCGCRSTQVCCEVDNGSWAAARAADFLQLQSRMAVLGWRNKSTSNQGRVGMKREGGEKGTCSDWGGQTAVDRSGGKGGQLLQSDMMGWGRWAVVAADWGGRGVIATDRDHECRLGGEQGWMGSVN
jgi:hypothetical protein